MPRQKQNPQSQIPFAGAFSPRIDPQVSLNQLRIQPRRELLEIALSQINFGLVDVTPICNSLSTSRLYSAVLPWAQAQISNAINTGQITDALHRVVICSLTVGWIAHESRVEAKILQRLVLEPCSTPQASDASHQSSRKAGRQ